MKFASPRQIKLSQARKAVPTKDGKAFALQFEHGSLQGEIYAPKGTDPQKPHSRDELYVVASGAGWVVVDGQRLQFGPGDPLFAAAGAVHRFEYLLDDL